MYIQIAEKFALKIGLRYSSHSKNIRKGRGMNAMMEGVYCDNT